MQRRDFFKTSLVASAVLLDSTVSATTTKKPIDTQEISTVAFPEKRPLITYSDRPPLLETPRDAFTKAITPNDEFFVRWHMPRIPTHTYINTYRINIGGHVEKPLSLSLKDLKNNYEQVEITAVMQCGGNSRSAFEPSPSGIQWGSGAMGCALWKGVRLSDVLKSAKMKSGSYRIPDNECECETPQNIESKTKPITTMNVKSYIGYPTSKTQINVGSNVLLKGVAFDSGSGIKEVQISTNKGKTWESAELEKELSLHAFRVFKFAFRVMKKGKFTIMAKAINNLDEAQPFANEIEWNHGGYKYNGIDSVTIEVL